MTTRRPPVVPPNMTLSDAVLAEIEELRAKGELGDGSRTEPRCHVCCQQESRDLVNKLIAVGLTNREITESCEAINNRRRDQGDERLIGARNVWWHRRQHFNIQTPAAAVAREILERRAHEDNRDYINGVGHAITPYGVIETTMVRGYQQRLVPESADAPTITETLKAAALLHELTHQDAGQKKMADLMYTLDRIIEAAQEFVPVEQQQAFLARVEGREAPRPLAVLTERTHAQAQEAIREFTPTIKLDDQDEI